jgi:hypothetical protein
MIEVGSSQNDAGLAYASCFFSVGLADRAAAMIAPGPTILVVPPSIR